MKTPWLKFALLLGVLFLASCRDNCESQCRERYWDGYRAGESSGYDRGYNAGHREGYSEGESDGYRSGYLSGAQSYIGDSFFPSLAGAAILALFIISFVAFKRFFHKSIGEIVNDIMLWLHNAYSYFSLRRKVTTLEKFQLNRAEIAAKVSALELFSKVNSHVEDLTYENEFSLILLKIEQYLIALNEVSRHGTNDEVRRLAEATMIAKGVSQGERQELLNSIRLILISKLSENQNLMRYERSSYNKISKKCAAYMKHRKRYSFLKKMRNFTFYTSVAINICLATGLLTFLFLPDFFYSTLSRLDIIASSLLP